MKRLISAFYNSVAAFKHLVKNEAAFAQECAVLAVSVPLAYMIASSVAQTMLLIGVIIFVIIVEVLNTAVEAACDALTSEFNANIKIAKDCGSLAVLLAIFIAATVWLFAIANWIYR